MRWTGTRIPRHMDTPPVIEGGVYNACETLVLQFWPEDYYVIPAPRHIRMHRTPRRQPQRLPYWQVALVAAWLAVTWVWNALDPEATNG